MSEFTATTMVIVGTGMNAAKDVKRGHDPFPTILAGALLTFGVALVGDIANPGFASALAGVFLLGSFLTSGVEVFTAAGNAVTSKKG